MEKKNSQKFNWKKIAAVGGVFLLGAVVGAIGGEKILSAISMDDDTIFEGYAFKITDHSALIRFTTISPKTGRKLHARLTETEALGIFEGLKKTLDKFGVEVSK